MYPELVLSKYDLILGDCLCVYYSEVDENPDYDNLDIVSRDAEDKYFDEDDEEEEDEGGNDEEEKDMTE